MNGDSEKLPWQRMRMDHATPASNPAGPRIPGIVDRCPECPGRDSRDETYRPGMPAEPIPIRREGSRARPGRFPSLAIDFQLAAEPESQGGAHGLVSMH